MYHKSLMEILDDFKLYDVFSCGYGRECCLQRFQREGFCYKPRKKGSTQTQVLEKFIKKLKSMKKKGISLFSDFYPYEPSLNMPASFLGTPISIEGDVVGYMIFQLPKEQLNSITNFNGKYDAVGMGKSGQVALVGSDMYMRNDNRFIDKIKQKNKEVASIGTTIGVLQVQSKAAKAATEGKSGNEVITGNLGSKVLTSYSAVHVFDATWGLVVKKNYDEALVSAFQLRNMIIGISTVITIIALFITIVIIRRIVLKKITGLTEITKKYSHW